MLTVPLREQSSGFCVHGHWGRMVRWRLACAIMMTVGCDGAQEDVDGGRRDGGSAEDAGPASMCAGATDGTTCGDARICVDGICMESRCGDTIVDDRTEACDDGNTIAFDGCELDCQRTCTEDSMCVDTEICNGQETCGDNGCVPGTMLDDGTSCGMDLVCAAGACVPIGCGNGVTDDGEDCDDMNADEADGCTTECRFTCLDSGDCGDGNACNGAEACDVASHTCMPATDLVCNDGSACTTDTCDPAVVEGCVFTLIDDDGDGEAATSLGACGTDCNDTRADTCRGCSEVCNNGRDDNCNGVVDDGLTTWFADCDGDGYGATGAVTVMQCTTPSTSLTGCGTAAARWIVRNPATNPDCNDAIAAVRPGAIEIVGNERDDDCNGQEICFRNNDGDSHRTTATIASSDADCDDNDEAAASVPSGDCCDSDARVRPGATTYYTSLNGPSVCGGWDFNCDGVASPQHIDREDRGCNWDGDSCSVPTGTDGWHMHNFGTCNAAPSPYPPCGAPAYCRVANCQGGFPSCSYSTIAAVRQGCR
jgi:cysteine-rich repeat protein